MLLVKPFSLQSLKTAYRDPFQTESRDQSQPFSFQEQLEHSYAAFHAEPTRLAKNQYLHQLLDSNELLFYQLVKRHLKDMLPILYTPTVGAVVRTFNQTRSSTRGLYISWEDRDRIDRLLEPYIDAAIHIAVLTDGERILGLGDQGVGGIEICIAKAMTYVLFGLIAPYRLLPIYLDVGTNNADLLNDPSYKGLRRERLSQHDYDDFIDTVVKSLHQKFPGIYLHWEDLERCNAKRILTRYQSQYCMFNDDMQGTGVVTLAGALAAVNITQVPLTEQRIIIVGGGTAGLGIADQLCQAMQSMQLSLQEARQRIWLVGRSGLLFSDSATLNDLQKPYARPLEERKRYTTCTREEVNLDAVVAKVRPTFLIGCSGKAGMFTEAMIKTMAKQVARPIIFPLSNPSECCEALPGDILRWTNGRALIATGSPFDDEIVNQQRYPITQCNNVLAFPGIGLGIQASRAPLLTDDMLWAACLALSRATPSFSKENVLLPTMANICSASEKVALAVYQASKNLSNKVTTSDQLQCVQDQYWAPLVE